MISCRKLLNEPQGGLELMATPSGQSITIREIMHKLPMTILYNMGDSFQLRLDEAQWMEDDSSLSVRIPTTAAGDRFLYAVKSGGALKVYFQINYNESGDYALGTYNGTMELLDLQTLTVYGQKYEENQAVAHITPTKLLDTDVENWECKAISGGFLSMGLDGKIHGQDTSALNLAQKGGPHDCWDPNKGRFRNGVRQSFRRLGEILSENDPNSPTIPNPPVPVFLGGNGDVWQGGGYNGGPGGANGNPNNANPHFNHPRYAPGYGPNTGQTQTLMQASNNPNYGPSSYVDANGYLYTRKAALQVYLQGEPYGAIDCTFLNQYPNLLNLWQSIASYQVPQTVLNSIDMKINANAPTYSSNNTYIQKLQDGIGVVNLDVFRFRITQLPKNALGQVMTPQEFLEFFRKNLTNVFNQGNSTTFSPFVHFSPGAVNIDETNLFNAHGSSALGAWGHFHIPAPQTWLPFMNDGSIVLSEYHENHSTQTYWYTFTTMATAYDGWHPVAGNRRFGITPDPAGGCYFYISGVDRVWDNFGHFLNEAGGTIFDGADALWLNILANAMAYVNANQGSAVAYNPDNIRLRPDWDTKIKAFLQGNIDLNTLKAWLGCP